MCFQLLKPLLILFVFKETEELTRLSRSKGLFLMEGIWPRFLPSYRFVRKQLNDGVIGDVYHINANIGSKADSVERIVKKELGGGTVVDMGVYCIDIIGQVYRNEMPEQIKCIGHLNTEGVDIDCSAALQFSRNRSATITSHSCLELPREIHICGTQGYIKVYFVTLESMPI
jgi:dihydrodiol dehydrogenase / D-xylose 1-dehydrogenase (NADP)